MKDTKALFASRTVWGALIVIVAQLLTIFGVSADLVGESSAWLDSVVTLAGAGIAIWGRIVASKRIETPLNPVPPSTGNMWACVAMLTLMVSAIGCRPDRAYIAADRATYDAVAPEYRTYVDSDSTLTPEQRDRRHRTLDTWDIRLRAATRPAPK